jgi:hypothetical protein
MLNLTKENMHLREKGDKRCTFNFVVVTCNTMLIK